MLSAVEAFLRVFPSSRLSRLFTRFDILPFAVDQKEAKVLSKLSFPPRHVFFFPARNPECPPKTVPAFAGPDYFDRPSLLFTLQ